MAEQNISLLIIKRKENAVDCLRVSRGSPTNLELFKENLMGEIL